MSYSIICGTNRNKNATQYVAKIYQSIIESKRISVSYLGMEELPHDFVFKNEVFGDASPDFQKAIEKHIDTAEKIIIVSPEYNGSMPGALKAFIDGIKPAHFQNKKICLVGVASGRYGNLRGMDHLTGIFHHLGCHILPQKIAVTAIDKILNDQKQITDERTLHFINTQIDQFIAF